MADFIGLLFLIGGFTIFWRIKLKHPYIGIILLVAFLVRALVALIFYFNLIVLPITFGDDIMFDRIAAEWASLGPSGILTKFTTGSFMYSWVLAVFYSIFGYSPLIAQALNVFFGTLIVYSIYLIGSLFWGEYFARRAAWCAAFFPTLVLFSAIILREVVVVFPFMLGILYFARWLQREQLKDLVKSFAALTISLGFHTGILPAVLMIGLAAFRRWLDASVAAKAKPMLKRFFVLCFVALGICVILGAGWGLEKLGRRSGSDGLVEWIRDQQRKTAYGRAAYLQNLQPTSLLDVIWQTPIRVVYFLFMPFPWLVSSFADFLGLIIVVLNTFIFLHIMCSLRLILHHDVTRWTFYILAVLIITFSLSTSNYGTAIRHSSKFIPLALTLVRIPRFKL